MIIADFWKTRNYRILVFLLLVFLKSVAQPDSNLVITFDFNDHLVKEKNDRVTCSAPGTSLTNDRFGNELSSIYLHGNPNCYFSLGTSPLLKPQKGTISLWVNLDRYIYAGRGLEFNTIIGTRNTKLDDFNASWGIYYDFKSKRLCLTAHKDSTFEVNIRSKSEFEFAKWHHLALVFDDSKYSFYINGELQQTSSKNYTVKYDLEDSVIVGHSANFKNHRWSQGMFDDIQIFHRALNANEIKALYEAPNPNKTKLMVMEIARYAAIVLVFVFIIVIIMIQNKRRLNKQREQFELQSRISELEIKVIKNQMNPHFISNCLAAIQELIYTKNYKEATQYIAKFSFFLRQVLNFSEKTYITLSEELTLIRLNIELEQLRFKGEFEFKLHVDDTINLHEVLIPSLITQPFIENAIWHGLLPLEHKRKAILKINIYEDEGSIFLEIEDNGVGRKLPNGVPDKDSKGTKLVRDKLDSINKLLRGNDYRLEIVDLKDSEGDATGTKIILQLKNYEE